MSIKDPYLVNLSGLDVHLRDARHAHQLYTEHSFAIAPKTKFLYHVVFELYDEVKTFGSNTDNFKKEIGVLVKQSDLPGYRVSVENKQQYNRKKNIQTRLDYEDVTIQFHDDNLGLTRGLLEDYYKYYYVDGNHGSQSGFSQSFQGTNAFNARDKYDEKVPNYGLNNYKINPFFKFVRIYQLARRQWFAYTLVNPIITQFNHGDVESAAGGDFNANQISLAYESVIYSNGEVNERGEPVVFTDPETRYDNVMSPLGYWDNTMSRGVDNLSREPKLFSGMRNLGRGSIFPRSRNDNSRGNSILRNVGRALEREDGALGMIGAGLQDLFSVTQPGGLLGSRIPQLDSRPPQSSSILAQGNGRILDTDTIINDFNRRPTAKASFVSRALNSNAISNQTVSTYNASSATGRAAIEDELTTRATSGNDIKLQKIATDAIESTKGTMV